MNKSILVIIMMVFINPVVAGNSIPYAYLRVHCTYSGDNCTQITLKDDNGKKITSLFEGDQSIPIAKAGHIHVSIWDIFGRDNIGYFYMDKELAPRCKFYLHLTDWFLVVKVNRFQLVCN